MTKNKSISDLVLEFFKNHPNQDLNHSPVVDWVEKNMLNYIIKNPEILGEQ